MIGVLAHLFEERVMTMTDRDNQQADQNAAIKDPDEWVTGDEPPTAAQESYLHTLAREANAEIPADLTKAEASKQIDELQAETGRGQ
ncbi:DUF3072 family protein [Micromonospora taraxaci]|uniref:DUF3072 family protein n=2 Tax=Micromonosporaceae TaxID=28056 RepID=A0A561W638_9ACTN|nr:DUF3072 family protein [Micromonospora taraxaci]